MRLSDDMPSDASWVPVSIRQRNGQRLVEWIYTGTQPYTEPFFDDTIARCRNHRLNSSEYIPSSTLEFLADNSFSEDSLSPTAFIFHVSRCGSTLLSQLLSLDERHIVLSEVPVFDHLLREPSLDERERCDLLRKTILLYGQKRHGHEQRLFIKFDAWHIYDYRLIRQCFPETPCVFLYREPAAVMHSHLLRRGAHMVPGQVLHPFDTDKPVVSDLDAYCANVLRCYYEAGLQLCQSDSNAFALNYHEGILEGLIRICYQIGLILESPLLERMTERIMAHSKYPGERFQVETRPFEPDHASYRAARQAYERLAFI